MNSADNFKAVGLTRGDLSGGMKRRITEFAVDELSQRKELQRLQANVVQHQCEIYFVPKDDEQHWQMLCELVGVAPDTYSEILLVNGDMMAVGGEFGLTFPNQLGTYAGADLLRKFGGFGTNLHHPAITRNR
jgi:hypothetical protein